MARGNLFLFVEPQAGRRHVHVTEQRTKVDFAHEMQWLVDIGYPEAAGDSRGAGQSQHA